MLSTFNGANFLDAQLQSLVNQSCKNFQVFIRDDGSTDETREIIKKYTKILNIVFDEDQNHYGLFLSYSRLLKEVQNFEFIALCDQDDVWDPDKILYSITQLESSGALLLVHRYELLIDEKVVEQGVSFGIGSESFAYIATRNVYPGNTFLFQGKLLEYFDHKIDVPHDWQLILKALQVNSVVFSTEVLSKYRIHDLNAFGVRFGFRNPYELLLKAAEIFRWRSLIFQFDIDPTRVKRSCNRPIKLVQLIIKERRISYLMKLNLLLRVSIQSLANQLVNTSLLEKSKLE